MALKYNTSNGISEFSHAHIVRKYLRRLTKIVARCTLHYTGIRIPLESFMYVLRR
jgi:hypothetical protein